MKTIQTIFKIEKISARSRARLGSFDLPHGVVPTPAFMPVGTVGTVKHLSGAELRAIGADIMLANTYHLHLRPGEAVIRRQGGIAAWNGWDGPVLTDSGGFQVFSLAGKRPDGANLVRISDTGVEFRSHLDGRKVMFTPEKVLRIQRDLGVDIAVALDVCPALPSERKQIASAVERTSLWARAAKREAERWRGRGPYVFAVVQGGLERDLRLKSAAELGELGFDGYNIGGLSVGEKPSEMYAVLDYLAPALPAERSRYLMGVGYPDNILEAVKRGIDLFDCVIPSREGRHGRLYLPFAPWPENLTRRKRGSFYEAMNITLARYRTDKQPINPHSRQPALRTLSRSYLHHLFRAGEPLGARLATMNNIEFYIDMMSAIRYHIANDRL